MEESANDQNPAGSVAIEDFADEGALHTSAAVRDTNHWPYSEEHKTRLKGRNPRYCALTVLAQLMGGVV